MSKARDVSGGDCGRGEEGVRQYGDYFVYALIALNFGACVAYVWQGVWVKAFYWLCVVGLNWCLLQMKGE